MKRGSYNLKSDVAYEDKLGLSWVKLSQCRGYSNTYNFAFDIKVIWEPILRATLCYPAERSLTSLGTLFNIPCVAL